MILLFYMGKPHVWDTRLPRTSERVPWGEWVQLVMSKHERVLYANRRFSKRFRFKWFTVFTWIIITYNIYMLARPRLAHPYMRATVENNIVTRGPLTPFSSLALGMWRNECVHGDTNMVRPKKNELANRVHRLTNPIKCIQENVFIPHHVNIWSAH